MGQRWARWRGTIRDTLHRQVTSSVAKGARLLLGGTVPNHPGTYYLPTVITDVNKGMPAYEEELFGPVAAIIPTRSEVEAIAVANDTAFGLGGAVITRDLARGEKIAKPRSKREWSLSTTTFILIRECHLEASRKAAMDVNCPPTASGSSSTSRP